MADENYEVGYGKPPKKTQFQPGQSGNPKGRPKGVKSLSTDLEEELSEKVLVSEAGQQLSVTKQRAMLKTLFAKALKGETRAAHVLINLIVGLEQAAAKTGPVIDEMSTEDLAVLESYRQRLMDQLNDEQKGNLS